MRILTSKIHTRIATDFDRLVMNNIVEFRQKNLEYLTWAIPVRIRITNTAGSISITECSKKPSMSAILFLSESSSFPLLEVILMNFSWLEFPGFKKESWKELRANGLMSWLNGNFMSYAKSFSDSFLSTTNAGIKFLSLP